MTSQCSTNGTDSQPQNTDPNDARPDPHDKGTLFGTTLGMQSHLGKKKNTQPPKPPQNQRKGKAIRPTFVPVSPWRKPPKLVFSNAPAQESLLVSTAPSFSSMSRRLSFSSRSDSGSSHSAVCTARLNFANDGFVYYRTPSLMLLQYCDKYCTPSLDQETPHDSSSMGAFPPPAPRSTYDK